MDDKKMNDGEEIIAIVIPFPRAGMLEAARVALDEWVKVWDAVVDGNGITVDERIGASGKAAIEWTLARLAKRLDARDVELEDVHGQHIYGSFYRPMSSMWARFDGLAFRDAGRGRGKTGADIVPWSYAIIADVLPQDRIDNWELDYLGFKA